MNIKLSDGELREALKLWVVKKFTDLYTIDEVDVQAYGIEIQIEAIEAIEDVENASKD